MSAGGRKCPSAPNVGISLRNAGLTEPCYRLLPTSGCTLGADIGSIRFAECQPESRITLPGFRTLRLSFKRDADNPAAGNVSLYIGERLAGERHIERLGPSVLGSFGVGQAYTSPISDDYALPFAFTGTLERLRLSIQ